MHESENFISTWMSQINGVFMKNRQFCSDKMVRTATSMLAGKVGKNCWSDKRNN